MVSVFDEDVIDILATNRKNLRSTNPKAGIGRVLLGRQEGTNPHDCWAVDLRGYIREYIDSDGS